MSILRIFCALAIAVVSQVRGETFTDDFARQDGDWVGVGGRADSLGDAYTVACGKFRVEGENLVTEKGASDEKDILIEEAATPLDSGGKFRASVDFMLPEPWTDTAAGIAVNYVTHGRGNRRMNCVMWRGEGDGQRLQFLEFSPSGVLRAATIGRGVRIIPGQWYTLAISCDSFPSLEVSLQEKDGAEIGSGAVDLTESPASEGSVALFATGDSQIRFDNLRIETE